MRPRSEPAGSALLAELLLGLERHGADVGHRLLRRHGAVQDLDAVVEIGLGDAVLEQHVEHVDALGEAWRRP